MKVMVFGTFDLLHEGHKYFLKKAKEHGAVVAVVARDSNVKKIKGFFPEQNEHERLKSVQQYVDKAILGNETDFFKVIELEKPDLLCYGYDQVQRKEELKKRGIVVKSIVIDAYMPGKYKSSLLRKNK